MKNLWRFYLKHLFLTSFRTSHKPYFPWSVNSSQSRLIYGKGQNTVTVSSILCNSFRSNRYSMRGTLCKVSLQKKLEFNKVCHFFYNYFYERFQVVKLGGIALKTLMKIVYQFQIFIHYKYKVMIISSQGCCDPDLCRNTMKYINTHKHRDAVEIILHFINKK